MKSINSAMPKTMRSTDKYFTKEYLFPAIKAPSIITGIGLHDLPKT